MFKNGDIVRVKTRGDYHFSDYGSEGRIVRIYSNNRCRVKFYKLARRDQLTGYTSFDIFLEHLELIMNNKVINLSGLAKWCKEMYK